MQIQFVYADQYNKFHAEYLSILSGVPLEMFPSRDQIFKELSNIQNIWNDIGQRVLDQIQEVTQLSFQEQKILCYIAGRARPFSAPLTMSVYFKSTNKFEKNIFFEFLTHELIHIIIHQNGLSEDFNWLKVYFSSIQSRARAHILIHALHKEIFLRFFNEKRLNEHANFLMQMNEDYLVSWRALNEIDHKLVIDEFYKYAKT